MSFDEWYDEDGNALRTPQKVDLVGAVANDFVPHSPFCERREAQAMLRVREAMLGDLAQKQSRATIALFHVDGTVEFLKAANENGLTVVQDNEKGRVASR